MSRSFAAVETIIIGRISISSTSTSPSSLSSSLIKLLNFDGSFHCARSKTRSVLKVASLEN